MPRHWRNSALPEHVNAPEIMLIFLNRFYRML